MKMQVTCPCGCGHTFEVEVPKGTKNFSEEERAKRAERMKAISAARIGTHSDKPRKVRKDKGVKRGPRDCNVFELISDEPDPRVNEFMDKCHSFVQDPEKCPYSYRNAGPCDMVVFDDDGTAKPCTSMLSCYFKYKKHSTFGPDDQGTTH